MNQLGKRNKMVYCIFANDFPICQLFCELVARHLVSLIRVLALEGFGTLWITQRRSTAKTRSTAHLTTWQKESGKRKNKIWRIMLAPVCLEIQLWAVPLIFALTGCSQPSTRTAQSDYRHQLSLPTYQPSFFLFSPFLLRDHTQLSFPQPPLENDHNPSQLSKHSLTWIGIPSRPQSMAIVLIKRFEQRSV